MKRSGAGLQTCVGRPRPTSRAAADFPPPAFRTLSVPITTLRLLIDCFRCDIPQTHLHTLRPLNERGSFSGGYLVRALLSQIFRRHTTLLIALLAIAALLT